MTSVRTEFWRLHAAAAVLAAGCLFAPTVRAQQYLAFPPTIGAAAPDAFAASDKYSFAPRSPFVANDPLYQGVHAGLWTIYPLVQTSVRYDDNILGAHLKPLADAYLDVAPSIVVSRSDGIHGTLLYGALDSNQYLQVAKADHTNLRTGFEEMWEARRDLVFTATGDVTRSSDLSSTGAPVAQGGFLPVSATTVRGSLSMLKTAQDFLFKTSVVGSSIAYGEASTPTGLLSNQGYRDYNDYLLIQRVGYSPGSNAGIFEETTLSKQDLYRSPSSGSTGVRQVIGAGAQQWRNFSGEVFVGGQERTYASSAIGTVWQPVWGGAISWRPVEYIELTLSQDQLIQTTNTISPTTPQIGLMRSIDTSFSATYARSRDWRSQLNIKYESDNYIDNPERDRILFIGLELDYSFTRFLLINCGFQRVYDWSNIAANAYAKDVTYIGFSYRY